MTSTALMTLTNERIGDNKSLQAFVDRAKSITIPLFPETVQFDTGYKFGAGLVSVDLSNNKDVYKNESGGFCLHLSKLNEIGQQAGVQIVDSRIIERKTDENGQPTFVSHQITGKLKSVDGSIKQITVTGKYDYYNDKNSNKTDGQVKGRRKHAEALAESNALTRLYNKLLAKIPSSFTAEELKKPFLIPYVLEDKEELIKDLPEKDQVAIKKQLAMKRLGLADAIYGAPRQIEDAKVTVLPNDDDDDDVPPAAPQIQPASDRERAHNKDEAEAFRDAPQAERTTTILNLIKLKGWKSEKNPNAIINAEAVEKTPLDRQIALIEELLNMPDEVLSL